MLATRVKICGLTTEQDVQHACSAGADALGFVFYAPSTRFVSAERAAQLSAIVPPFVQRVGLFVNADAAEVNRVLDCVSLDLLQFHGDEEAAFCESFRLPYIKAFSAKKNTDLVAAMDAHPNARGFLIDSYKPGQPGGTGEVFDWALFPEYDKKPLILAGGLNANNVSRAVSQLNPYAVDVSGGVESLPGHKSDSSVTAFITAVKSLKETP